MRFFALFTLLFYLAFLGGCATQVPKDVLALSPTSLEDKQLQSRKFNTTDEIALLAAAIGVLQDMGYTIEETEKNIGLITCSKNADATDAGQVTAAIVVALLGGGAMPIDKEQKIRVSLVTMPSKNETDTYIARITFQRLIWNTNNQVTTAETIKDPEIYQGFFEKLSKSVFLEAHKI
jgi:hypothetical protein